MNKWVDINFFKKEKCFPIIFYCRNGICLRKKESIEYIHLLCLFPAAQIDTFNLPQLVSLYRKLAYDLDESISKILISKTISLFLQVNKGSAYLTYSKFSPLEHISV